MTNFVLPAYICVLSTENNLPIQTLKAFAINPLFYIRQSGDTAIFVNAKTKTAFWKTSKINNVVTIGSATNVVTQNNRYPLVRAIDKLQQFNFSHWAAKCGSDPKTLTREFSKTVLKFYISTGIMPAINQTKFGVLVEIPRGYLSITADDKNTFEVAIEDRARKLIDDTHRKLNSDDLIKILNIKYYKKQQ